MTILPGDANRTVRATADFDPPFIAGRQKANRQSIVTAKDRIRIELLAGKGRMPPNTSYLFKTPPFTLD